MGTTVTSGVESWLENEQRREIQLGYRAFPKQREFHQCGAKYRLFGGAAGPGKSKALLMEAIAQATETPGANTLLLRRTFPELEGSLLLYFRRDVPRECYRSFNEAKHTVTWHNGSTTRFGYSQSENDIYQYQSSEFLFIGIDELTHFTLRQWQFLTSRNRCPVPSAFCNMAGATNPGNIGHAWVKSLFIDKQPAAGMEPREYDANDYAFISASVWDNPIYAKDSEYLKTLQQLPDFYRRAFLDGDWSVFAGQYFSNFDPSRSVIRAEKIAAEAWWPRWISIDWGFEHPAAVYWHVLEAGGPKRDGGAALSWGRNGLTSVAANGAATGRELQNCAEAHRHRHADSQTRESGDSPSANNIANSPAGDAGLREYPVKGLTSVAANGAATERELQNFGEWGEVYKRRDFYDGRAAGGPQQVYEQAGRASHSAAFAVESDAPASQQEYFADSSLHETRPASRVPRWPPNADSRAFGVEADAAAPTFSDRVNEQKDLTSVPINDMGTGRELQNCAGNNAATLPASGQAGPVRFVQGRRELQNVAAKPRAATITYREFIAQHLPPRILAAQIIERSRLRTGATEKIEAVYLSPDAFARRTDESSIAEQMGDILQSAGLPRPVPADNDRIGGWMLMYQILDADEWLIADSCPELIRTLPELVRDEVNIEDIAKRDGDDAADAARYGLKSRASGQTSRLPREQELAQRVTSSDPTIRAIQARKAELEVPRRGQPVFGRFSRWRRK